MDNGYQRMEMEAAPRLNQARNPNAANVKIPKMLRTSFNLTEFVISLGIYLQKYEQTVSEFRFQHDSFNNIATHNKYIKIFLHKYRHIFGDTKEMFDLLKKYEESDLCKEEIFQAKMINCLLYTSPSPRDA